MLTISSSLSKFKKPLDNIIGGLDLFGQVACQRIKEKTVLFRLGDGKKKVTTLRLRSKLVKEPVQHNCVVHVCRLTLCNEIEFGK